jgi:hypothetical protein
MKKIYFILVLSCLFLQLNINAEISKNVSYSFYNSYIEYENYKSFVTPTFIKISNFNNNLGNIVSFKTGKFRSFDTMEDGYKALIKDLELKITGKSIWTDENTTLQDMINIYAPSFENNTNLYIKVVCQELNITPCTKINTLKPEYLARGIIKMEHRNIYNIIYG